MRRAMPADQVRTARACAVAPRTFGQGRGQIGVLHQPQIIVAAKNLASLLAAMGHAGLAVERLRPALLRLRLPMGEGGVDAVHGANCRPQAKWSIPTGC